MKTKTKILLFIIIAFVLTIVPNKAFAGTYNNLTYDFNYDKEIVIKGCVNKNATSVSIPSYIDGYKVTEIDYYAFENCKNLSSVSIPSTITQMGHNCFSNCTNLKTISIPDSVTQMDNNIFKGCTSLQNVKLPNKIKKLDYSIFAGCSSLKSISLPSSIVELGSSEFENCTNLTSITIPSKVTVLSSLTFKGCTRLTTVNLPSTLKDIYANAFENCSALKNINFPSKLETIGSYSFQNCTSLTNLTIPDSVEAMSWSCFKGCSGLTTVVLPSNPNLWIDDSAFDSPNTKATFYVKRDTPAHQFVMKKDLKYKTYTANISECKITGIKTKTYSGSAQTQTLTVKYGNLTLKQGTDYTASYSNNVNTGKATITINGVGNYRGTINKTFYIVPKKVTGIAKTTQTSTSITLKWSKVTGASGYDIYKYNGSKKKYELVATQRSGTTYKVSGLKTGTTYLFRIKAYKGISGKKHYGSVSAIYRATTQPGVVGITSAKSTASRKATITWKKVNGASGYYIYMATSPNGPYKKVKTAVGGTKVRYTRTGLTSGKTYYFKVRAYKNYGGAKYTGAAATKPGTVKVK